MATLPATKVNGNGKHKAPKTTKATKTTKAAPAKAATAAPQAAAPKHVAYPGFCTGLGFSNVLKTAEELLVSARAKYEDLRFALYVITPSPKDAARVDGVIYSESKGYAVGSGFDRSAVKAEKMLAAAKKHAAGFKLYRVEPTKDHARGTKQAKLAAKKEE